jgi:hypothetical protein
MRPHISAGYTKPGLRDRARSPQEQSVHDQEGEYVGSGPGNGLRTNGLALWFCFVSFISTSIFQLRVLRVQRDLVCVSSERSSFVLLLSLSLPPFFPLGAFHAFYLLDCSTCTTVRYGTVRGMRDFIWLHAHSTAHPTCIPPSTSSVYCLLCMYCFLRYPPYTVEL